MGGRIPERRSPATPAGDTKSAWLAVLEQGAHVLQPAAPLRGFHAYVVGFHCANLIGIEDIVSERLSATLPEDEQSSWHPHDLA